MARPTRLNSKWRIRWIDEYGTRCSAVYLTREDALVELRKKEIAVYEIKSGIRLPTPKRKTFSELCDYYLAFVSSTKRRRRDDESIIRKHLRPFFGSYDLCSVRLYVDQFKLEHQHKSAKTLHNYLTLLKAMLRVAVRQGWLEAVPEIRKPRIRVLDRDYKFLKTNHEIQVFLEAARLIDGMAFCLYGTALCTGFRAGELAGLKWRDIDLAKRLIHVRGSYDGPTKNMESRVIPILDPLLPILKILEAKRISDHVFYNKWGKPLIECARLFQETLHRTLEKSGLNELARAQGRKRYIVFHDLRHTFASHWMMSGGDIFKLQRILGHKSIEMTQRYSHLAPEAFIADHSRIDFGILHGNAQFQCDTER